MNFHLVLFFIQRNIVNGICFFFSMNIVCSSVLQIISLDIILKISMTFYLLYTLLSYLFISDL